MSQQFLGTNLTKFVEPNWWNKYLFNEGTPEPSSGHDSCAIFKKNDTSSDDRVWVEMMVSK